MYAYFELSNAEYEIGCVLWVLVKLCKNKVIIPDWDAVEITLAFCY